MHFSNPQTCPGWTADPVGAVCNNAFLLISASTDPLPRPDARPRMGFSYQKRSGVHPQTCPGSRVSGRKRSPEVAFSLIFDPHRGGRGSPPEALRPTDPLPNCPGVMPETPRTFWENAIFRSFSLIFAPPRPDVRPRMGFSNQNRSEIHPQTCPGPPASGRERSLRNAFSLIFASTEPLPRHPDARRAAVGALQRLFSHRIRSQTAPE